MTSLFPENFKILVTGGCGFIGTHVIKKLLEKSNSKVFNLDKLSYASNNINNGSYFPIDKERYFFIKANLESKTETEEAIRISDPDLIFHLAAESHVDNSIESPSQFITSNIIGTYNLLEAARNHYSKLNQKRKKLFKFHHISTDEVFGSLGIEGSFTESTSYDPKSPYSASKASSDHLVRAWHHTFKLPVLITNCSNNFGPYQFPEKLIPKAINNALSGKEIPMYGEGNNIRDWLYVEDHVDALFLVAKSGKNGQSYCIGGHGEKTNKEILEEICLILDKVLPKENSYKKLIKKVKDRPGHDFRYSINPSKIKTELNWSPNYTFKKALEITIMWYLNQFKNKL